MEGFWKDRKQHTVGMVLILAGAVYLFLKYICPLVTPLLLAMLFVTIFGPVLQKLQARLHLPRQIGAAVLFVIALGIMLGLFSILGMWLLQSIPGWIRDLEKMTGELEGPMGNVGRELLSLLRSSKVREGFLDHLFSGQAELLTYVVRYGGKLAVIGGGFVTFFIATVLLAKDYDEMMNHLLAREDCYVLLEVICGVIRYLATFVKAQVMIIALIALLCGSVLGVFGIPQGIFWGILAGLLDALPFVGTGIVLLPLGLFGVLQGTYLQGVLCVVLYVCCIVIREFLEPKLIGKRMGVKPIYILSSLYIGIQLFGPWGIIKGPLGFIILRETWQHLKGIGTKNKE